MRTFLIILGLMALIGPARLIGQSAPGNAKPSPAAVNSPPDVRRGPAVVWKRGMSERVPEPAPDIELRQLKPEVPEARIPSPPKRTIVASPRIPVLRPILVTPPAQSGRTREQLLTAIGAIHAGAPRADVFAQLGQPAYSIGIPDGSHYIERCRFRAGLENLASIEMRDGYVIAIDRIAR